MIKTYIIIAWRSLLKNKLFSFINIFGLALSMSVCMMVIIRIVDNFDYDTFHPGSDRAYRIISEINNGEGDTWKLASTPLPLREALADGDSLGAVVNIYPAISESATDGTKDIFVNGVFTQPSFFKVFGFTLLHGDVQTALENPNSIILSKTTADKFFGEENPVGKMLSLEKLGPQQITGVLNTPAGKSHITYDVLVSSSGLKQLEKNKKLVSRSDTWDSFEYGYTYILLNENIKTDRLEKALDQLSASISKEARKGSFAFQTQSLSSITPGSNDIHNDIGRGRGSWMKLMTEAGIALIILLAACFNYTNLSLARALTRGKEVGIRKLSGAARWQIFVQYILEAVLVALLALCIGYIILSFILEFKPFNDGYEFVPDVQISVRLFLYFLVFTLGAGLLAGSMPAWILSSFKPVRILKNFAAERIAGNVGLRKILMVFQFTLSLTILIFLTTFYQQFSFMADADTGFSKEHIITIPFSANDQVFATEVQRIAGVEDVASLSGNFGKYVTGKASVSTGTSGEQPSKMDYYFADRGVVSVMGLSLLAGNNFPEVQSQKEQTILINEQGSEMLGFANYKDAVGAQVVLNDSIPVTVSGVIKNFYNEGVANPIRPLILRSRAGAYKVMNLKIAASAGPEVVRKLEQAWKKVYPDKAFSYSWLDRQLTSIHDQTATISLLGFLAFMTVIIASMGLLGLVVYTVETRRKEISIRKIIGARIDQLMLLLSKGFVKLLLIAGVIALPLGYILSQFFLQNFANRISIGIGSFVACLMLLLTIGLLAIIPQTYQASIENPAKNLRNE